MARITYVKADTIVAAGNASAAVVVDLGLGVDEAAKITGILLSAFFTGICTPAMYQNVQGSYSFDPEDAVVSWTDDEQFAGVRVDLSAGVAAVEPVKGSEIIFMDFSAMDVITTRNLALIVTAVEVGGGVVGKVYYEKYKPAANELIQLIAQRR
ncbi:unnamed protein product [marine sediment metagenome]|uniref:Uncharacterized protein n=1 Tax=marine sediment metagenome TaxID=412755 RepID=X1FHY3_9ZZZZ